MPSYVTPKNGVAWIGYVGLVSQANTKLLQVNPPLAAGDVKVSIDGGAAANLATLPTVTPAGGTRVKVSLSAAEMTGDNISVVFSDAAGAEWCDLFLNLQTSARQLDDLAFPTVAGTGSVAQTGDVYPKVDTEIAAIITTLGVAGAGLTALGDTRLANLDATVSSRTKPADTQARVTLVDTVTALSDKTGYALTAGERLSVADALLNRDLSAGTDSGSPTVRTVRQALRFLRNKWEVVTGTLTVYKEDDATPSHTAVLTGTAGAAPVTGSDPAGP